jgi:hypothetical protein
MLALIFVCPGKTLKLFFTAFFQRRGPNQCLESPRFLMKKGPRFYKTAYKSLVHLRDSPLLAAQELFYVHSQIQMENEILVKGVKDDGRYVESDLHPGINGHSNSHDGFENPNESGSELTRRRSSYQTEKAGSKNSDGRVKAEARQLSDDPSSAQSKPPSKKLLRSMRPHRTGSVNYWQKLGQLFTVPRIRRVS